MYVCAEFIVCSLGMICVLIVTSVAILLNWWRHYVLLLYLRTYIDVHVR